MVKKKLKMWFLPQGAAINAPCGKATIFFLQMQIVSLYIMKNKNLIFGILLLSLLLYSKGLFDNFD